MQDRILVIDLSSNQNPTSPVKFAVWEYFQIHPHDLSEESWLLCLMLKALF